MSETCKSCGAGVCAFCGQAHEILEVSVPDLPAVKILTCPNMPLNKMYGFSGG